MVVLLEPSIDCDLGLSEVFKQQPLNRLPQMMALSSMADL